MARIARVVAPGLPHHITQRGNRRQQTFFEEQDYQVYLDLMAEWCERFDVEIWAYCLMPNHVHLIAVPTVADGLRLAIGEAHRRFTRHINFRMKWRGHLWQERFASFPLDEEYLLAAIRYVEFNPVRARLTALPEEYPWSSARAHLSGQDDRLVKTKPMLELIPDWSLFLANRLDDETMETLRRHEQTGRPLGSELFLDKLETQLKRILKPKKPGRKPVKPDQPEWGFGGSIPF
ncbi:MAG: transposase [Magnetococcales bacterium]|nr:transposase [Magnetococcales bacterium]